MPLFVLDKPLMLKREWVKVGEKRRRKNSTDDVGSILIVVPIDGEILGCPFSVFIEIKMRSSSIQHQGTLPRRQIERACCGYLIRDPLPLRNYPKPPTVPIQTLWMYAADSEADFLHIDSEMAMKHVRDLFPRSDNCFTLSYHDVAPATGHVENHREFWREQSTVGDKEGWWLRAMGSHSDKGQVYAGCIIRVADFAQGFLKTESGIGVVRWRNEILHEDHPDMKTWVMVMEAGDEDEIVALNFWSVGLWGDDMVDGQRWTRTVRSMEVEWRCAKLLDW